MKCICSTCKKTAYAEKVPEEYLYLSDGLFFWCDQYGEPTGMCPNCGEKTVPLPVVKTTFTPFIPFDRGGC